MGNSHREQHVRADFARERALGCPVDVLRAELDVGACEELANDREVNIRRADDDVASCVLDERNEFRDQLFGFRGGHIHLPVSCDNRSSHVKIIPFKK
ncbi:hypothetical protein SDC9_205229 [bioreactor metagenome]|uniref:Uncharacterized protein n=1 Tax=bioreactor metagenome TaxID=1076179 RepID=A0A645J1H5_9ZZZZ